MNIEDLIKAANPVRTCDVPAGDSPPAQRALAQIRREPPAAAPAPAARAGRWRSARKRTLALAGLPVVAGATAVAVFLAVSGTGQAPPRAAPAPADRHTGTTAPAPKTAAPAPKPHTAPAHTLTARDVLLKAAAHVPPAPSTGKYWRVRLISGLTFPGGTKSDPYDITVAIGYDQWNPSAAGQNEWLITQAPGAVPATPADAAAWRAAGSPKTWRSGLSPYTTNGAFYPAGLPWTRPIDAHVKASPASATWTVSGAGTVGYVEGDEAGLNAAQFGQIPATARGVAALLRQDAEQTYCVKHPTAGCFTVDQLVWAEAVALLQDPVPAAVRSATFKVMAALPGVRLLGPMTDPLGRPGYALAAGPLVPTYGTYHPVQAVVIDPATGSLLATEDIGAVPRSAQCLTLTSDPRIGRGHPAVTQYYADGKPFTAWCIGPVYVGRSDPGQVDQFIALVSAGWTNASPVLPAATRQDTLGFPGLSPASTGDQPGMPPNPPARG